MDHYTTGLQHICEKMKILGVHIDGAFSEYAVLPAVCAWKLDSAISYPIGATMEPFGIAVHALAKTQPAGKNVLVFGCGPIGIYAQMVAKLSGAGMVIGVDIVPERLHLARQMGTDVVINAREHDVLEHVKHLTHGSGMDIVIELTGHHAVANQAASSLRRGGELILVGLFSTPVEIDLVNHIIYKEATVYGVTGRIMWDTWWTAQRMILSGKLDLQSVITHTFGLQDYEQAFELAESGKAGKIVFQIRG